MIDERNFIQKLREHDEQALEYVLRRYGGLLKSEIMNMLAKYPDDWDDCFSEVLMKIWNNIGSYDERKSSFPNWIVAVARYRAIDYLRRKERESGSLSLETLLENGGDKIGLSENQFGYDPQTKIENGGADFSHEMEKLLAGLSLGDRELFIKYYVEEIEMEELSRETGLTKPAIYNRLARGKKKLQMRRKRMKGGMSGE